MNRVEWMHPGQWPVYIGFTTSEDAFKRAMRRMRVPAAQAPHWINPGASATTHTFEQSGKNLCFIICIGPHGRQVSREQYAALIAHEALHVVQAMNREFSPQGRFDDESEAYLLQYIVQHCLQHAWKSNRTRSTAP